MASMTRRQLGMACAATALAVAGSQAWSAPAQVQLPQEGSAPALGLGSWRLAQGRHPIAEEEEALRTGLSLGMALIDTAEMYGSGRSEEMIGRVIAGQRPTVFLVSKVLPDHATMAGIREACAASLARLRTDHLDLYLLHWRGGGTDLGVVVAAFEALRRDGRIRHWGVSNFSVADMGELFRRPGGSACATNQVRYNLGDRSIEKDLQPWCERHGLPIMAYSPLGSGNDLLRHPVLARVAERNGVAPAAVAIAWTMRNGRTISIPESGSVEHVRQNAAALTLRLGAQDLADLDRAFPV
jgi:diketogulonate reductase-like aldo/keto reductase